MADVKHSLGEWQGALKHYEYAYKCAVTERDQLEAALRCGNMDLNFGNYVEATQRFLEVLRSPASTAEVDLALQAENFRGWIALYQGNHQLALCIFHGCLRNISSIGDPLLEATVWHFLGRTYHELGQHEEGIQMLRQAFTIEEREGANPRRLGHDYRWIAECQLGLGNEQRARELLLEASAIFQRESDPGGQAHIGVHQAKMILREGQPVAARELLLHSDAFWREIGYLRGVAECQYLTGCAYEAEGLHPHAAAAYLKAMRAYRKVRSPKCQAAFRALRRLRGILGDKQYQRIRRETE
jgi:tetratricopeptide (TPR) repeat protein